MTLSIDSELLEAARGELSDPGHLRVAINMGNLLLVVGTKDDGTPYGISPDMATGLAETLGVSVRLIPFPMPGDIADAMPDDAWDVTTIAIEPKRAEQIAFSDPYVLIEATYLVPEGSPFQSVDDVDAPGVTIAVANRAAYDLYLTRSLKHAELKRATGLPGAVELYTTEKLDALAGLAPVLKDNAASIPGSRVLPGRYTAVRQAIGTKHGNTSLQKVIAAYLAYHRDHGTVSTLIDQYGRTGRLIAAGEGD